jgi:hypothetical protein
MPKPKAKKVGRPFLPKGEAKGRIVPVRFKPEEVKRIESAAKANKQTISEWIRTTMAKIYWDRLCPVCSKTTRLGWSPSELQTELVNHSLKLWCHHCGESVAASQTEERELQKRLA